MPPLGPVKRKDLIWHLGQLGFEGPYSGGKHQFMVKGDITQRVITLARPQTENQTQNQTGKPTGRGKGGKKKMNAEKQEDLLTSGGIAKELGVSDSKVKKVLKELAIQPKAKKGICNFYSREALAKIKSALK